MTVIVTMTRDRAARARLAEGAAGSARAVHCDTVADVRRAVDALLGTADERLGAVVVEPRDCDGVPADALIAALRRDVPAVPVLVYCSPAREASADILAAARAGASGLILRGHDDVGAALRSALQSAADDCVARLIMRDLAPALPGAARLIVEHCVLHGREALTVSGVALALGVHRKTLVNRLSSGGLPGPRAVLAWSRLLLVAHELERTGRPLERIALDFDFPSAGALRGLLKRYTHLHPHEVRENGGLACVLHLFKRALLGGSADAPAELTTGPPPGDRPVDERAAMPRPPM